MKRCMFAGTCVELMLGLRPGRDQNGWRPYKGKRVCQAAHQQELWPGDERRGHFFRVRASFLCPAQMLSLSLSSEPLWISLWGSSPFLMESDQGHQRGRDCAEPGKAVSLSKAPAGVLLELGSTGSYPSLLRAGPLGPCSMPLHHKATTALRLAMLWVARGQQTRSNTV